MFWAHPPSSSRLLCSLCLSPQPRRRLRAFCRHPGLPGCTLSARTQAWHPKGTWEVFAGWLGAPRPLLRYLLRARHCPTHSVSCSFCTTLVPALRVSQLRHRKVRWPGITTRKGQTSDSCQAIGSRVCFSAYVSCPGAWKADRGLRSEVPQGPRASLQCPAPAPTLICTWPSAAWGSVAPSSGPPVAPEPTGGMRWSLEVLRQWGRCFECGGDWWAWGLQLSMAGSVVCACLHPWAPVSSSVERAEWQCLLGRAVGRLPS